MLKTRAIVLHTLRYGENSHIVRLFTREQGTMSCLVKGARRKPLPPVLMQPLSLVDLLLDVKPNRQFQFVRESAPTILFETIPYDPSKNAIAVFLSEVLWHALRESPAEPLLYDFVEQSVQLFDATSTGMSNFHLVFLIKLTRFLGFLPNVEGFRQGLLFDMENAQFVAHSINKHTLDAAQTSVFVQLMRIDFHNMPLFALSGAQRSDILRQILTYYRLQLPAFGEIKSLDVLQTVFG